MNCDKMILDQLPLKIIKSSSGAYQTNCPNCTDKRQRLYFLWDGAKRRTNVYCHNCGYSRILKNFLKDFYSDVLAGSYLAGIQDRSKVLNTTLKGMFANDKRKEKINFIKSREHPKSCILLEHLHSDHKAVKYVESRMIPRQHYKKLYYCTNFKELADEYGYKTEKIVDGRKVSWKEEDRLVIPFWDKNKKITHIQGRDFEKNSKMRYMTLDVQKTALKIWGLDTVDTSKLIYITEGPIDAMSLPNSLAIGGSNIPNNKLLKLLECEARNIVFVFDNEPDNKEIVKQMKRKAMNGFGVVVWDRNISYKDVNVAILEGFDVKEFENMTYWNTTALLKINQL